MKYPEDPIPVPQAVVLDDETAWQDFQDSVVAWEQQYADTDLTPLQVEEPSSTDPVILPEEDPFATVHKRSA